MMPLVIFLIVLIGLFVIAFYSTRRLKSNMQYKTKYRLITGYVIALVGITFIYVYAIQPNMTTAPYQKETTPYLFDIIYENENEIGELPEAYIDETWSLSSGIEELTIEVGDGQYNTNFWMDIIVDYNDVEEGKVVLYETPTTISGMDISEYVPLANVVVQNDAITIVGSDYVEINFHAVKNEMTLAQFTKDPDDFVLDHFDHHSGEQALFITLPENVKVNADEDFFYINYK